MADTPPPEATTTEPAPAAAGRATYIKAAVVVAGIVLLECIAAYLLIPSSEQATAMAELAVQNDPPELAEPEAEAAAEDEAMVEVDLESFHVSSYQPATNTTLRIDLHLFVVVNQEDEGEFLTLMEKHRHRIRERVLVIIRSAELGDLTDAGLGLIKRQILEKVNRILEKPLVQRVVISEFSFIEQ